MYLQVMPYFLTGTGVARVLYKLKQGSGGRRNKFIHQKPKMFKEVEETRSNIKREKYMVTSCTTMPSPTMQGAQ
jgi:hypothetical protein